MIVGVFAPNTCVTPLVNSELRKIDMHPGKNWMIPFLALMVATLITTSGCGISLEQDPATSVNLVITGIESEDARADIKEKLQGMTDGSGHMMSSQTVGDKMTVTLSPVTDVEAFIDAISFGTVTDVDGRKITIECKP